MLWLSIGLHLPLICPHLVTSSAGKTSTSEVSWHGMGGRPAGMVSCLASEAREGGQRGQLDSASRNAGSWAGHGGRATGLLGCLVQPPTPACSELCKPVRIALIALCACSNGRCSITPCTGGRLHLQPHSTLLCWSLTPTHLKRPAVQGPHVPAGKQLSNPAQEPSPAHFLPDEPVGSRQNAPLRHNPRRQNCGRQHLCRPSADKLEGSRRIRGSNQQPGHDRSALQKVDVLGSGDDRVTGPRVLKRPGRAGGFALVESECWLDCCIGQGMRCCCGWFGRLHKPASPWHSRYTCWAHLIKSVRAPAPLRAAWSAIGCCSPLRSWFEVASCRVYPPRVQASQACAALPALRSCSTRLTEHRSPVAEVSLACSKRPALLFSGSQGP